MDRSRYENLNNAGVLALSNGHVRAALDFFRGALETKLAYERMHPPMDVDESTGVTDNEDLWEQGGRPEGNEGPVMERCVTPDCVIRAENHLSNLDYFRTQREDTETSPVLEEGCLEPVIPYESRDFNPYLYLKPFELSRNPASTQLTSAIIVFNLGIVHHKGSRTSTKAAAFYEIAAALLSTEPVGDDNMLLRVAMMNNFGVWCFENGDGESLRTCMERLSTVLQNSGHSIETSVEQQVQRNISWLLTPPNGGSPAA